MSHGWAVLLCMFLVGCSALPKASVTPRVSKSAAFMSRAVTLRRGD